MKRSPSPLLRSYLLSQLLWNPLAAFVFTVGFGSRDFSFLSAAVSYIIGFTISSCCFALAGLTGWWVDRRAKVSARRRVRLQFAVASLGMPVGIAVVTAVLSGFGHHVGIRWHGDFRVWILPSLMGGLIAALFFLASERALARNELRDTELQLKTLENERLQAQLGALTSQVNPHLLFNALNTVAALIPTQPERAEETVLKLSELYRGVLGASERATHSLADELALCGAYLDVERVRFANRLNVVVEVDPALSPTALQVPVLLLQPLVENAVKHGLSHKLEGGTVKIRAQSCEPARVQLDVEDDGVGVGGSSRTGSGLGIANCRKRLVLTYAETATLEVSKREPSGTRVRIQLPAALPRAKA